LTGFLKLCELKIRQENLRIKSPVIREPYYRSMHHISCSTNEGQVHAVSLLAVAKRGLPLPALHKKCNASPQFFALELPYFGLFLAFRYEGSRVPTISMFSSRAVFYFDMLIFVTTRSRSATLCLIVLFGSLFFVLFHTPISFRSPAVFRGVLRGRAVCYIGSSCR
jgi:hypothetical protein